MRIITCSYNDEKILDDTVNQVIKDYLPDEIEEIKFSTCAVGNGYFGKTIWYSAMIIFK